MCSSSTASATTPCARACSASRTRAAWIKALVAVRSDASSSRDICRRAATKSPPPRSPRIDRKIPACHSASRSLSRSSDSISRASCAETVPRPAVRRDQLGLEAVVHLAPQPPHQNLEDVRERVMVVVPHVRRDRRPVEHLPLVPDEQLEQSELLRGERKGATAAAHVATGEVHLQ